MNFEKRLNGLEEKLSLSVSPERAALNIELWRRMAEGRKRVDESRAQDGTKPMQWTTLGDCLDQGASIADRLKAAAERRLSCQ